ncbi:unnamed protein product [Paramecium pentaurelia]|uniref:Macro domain-containing protein n=1 Tax=Paramecium pentaurelia TaxID=43138 RepID=A0A8S1SJ81_9CILI|nr:unnamed protein product [Paramecium pentaurelia]
MLSLIQGDIFQQQFEAIVLPSDIALLKAPGLQQLHHQLQQQCNEFKTNQTILSQIQQTSVITLSINHNQFKYIIHCIVPKQDINTKELSMSLLLEILFQNIFYEISFQKIKSILIPVLGCDNADFSIIEFLNTFKLIYEDQRQNFIDVKFILISQSQQEYELIKKYFQIANPNTLTINDIYQTIPQGNSTSITEKFKQYIQQNIKNNEIQKSNFSDGSEIAQYRKEYNANLSKKQQQDQQILGNSLGNSLNQNINQNNIHYQSENLKQQQIDRLQQSNQSIIITSAPLLQQNTMFLTLFIQIDNIILEQKDLIKFMLQVCYDLYKLHQQLFQNIENVEQSNQLFNYKLYYNQSANLNELQPYCPPEMSENQYISETHDSYSIGKFFKMVLEINYKSDQEDLQQINQIQQLLDKLISQANQRPQIDDIFNFLLSLQLDESLIEYWTQVQKNINYFYRKRGNMQKISDIKKQMLMKISPIYLNNYKTEDQYQDLNQQLNHQDSNSSLFNNIQQIKFKQDCEYAQREQNYKFCQIDCVVIPVDKYQFKQSLPTYIKFDSILDKVLDKIINLAQKDKEHYLQSIRSYVPIFGCNSILLVFCPNQNQTVEGQIQLTNCFSDILLYTLKCQKINTFCLCLDEISKKLIVNQNDLSMNILIKSFEETCNKSPDPIIWNEIQFNNQKWIVVKKNPFKLKLLEQSIIIHNQDITQIKGIDAIVNVTDPHLSNQGGICKAIFQAAGENLLVQEIKMMFQKLGKKQLDTSEVVVTKSYNLELENGPKYIFHTVGPKYNSQDPQKSIEQLSKCIFNILQKCQEYKISSIAIPPISARNCDFPKYQCAQIFYSAFLKFQFKNQMSIHIIDVIDNIVEIFQIIFKGEKLRQTIHSKIDFTPPTDCLVCPIDINNYNSQALKRIIELAGPSFQNELEYQIKNYQKKDDQKQCQSFLLQGHKMKFNNIYQILMISKPLNIIDKQTLLYQVFFQILVETFLKKKFTSITILFYSILQQFLNNQDDLIKNGGEQAINIFQKAIQNYQEKYLQECGKITILSNVAQFCTDCELIFK